MAKLTYACVLTRNIQALAAFYTGVLRAEPRWNGPYAEFSTEPGIFCLWSLDAYAEIAVRSSLPQPGAGAIMLEFEVDDVDAEFMRLQQSAGFKLDFILSPTTMAWGNRSIYFRDPDGNVVNFFTRVDSSS